MATWSLLPFAVCRKRESLRIKVRTLEVQRQRCCALPVQLGNNNVRIDVAQILVQYTLLIFQKFVWHSKLLGISWSKQFDISYILAGTFFEISIFLHF